MPPRSRPESPKRQGKGGYPNSDDQECPSSAYRALCASLRLLMELRHERGRDHFDNQEHSDGQDDHFIDIAKDGDEVRDEVDGAKRIGGDRRGGELHIPGHTGIARRDGEGYNVSLDLPAQFRSRAPVLIFWTA